MQAVILAAGASTRMLPLTETRPKPLLPVANVPLIDHTLIQLKGLVQEIVLVVGYKQEMLREHVQQSPHAKPFKIVFAEQKSQKGTADALLAAKPHVRDRFLVLNGDDLYSQEDIARCLRHKRCVLAAPVEHPEQFGVLRLDHENRVTAIVEKSAKPPTKLANTGLFVLDDSIFSIPMKKTKRNEYELTDLVTALSQKEPMAYELVKGYWLPVGYPWNLLEANAFLLSRQKRDIRGTVEKGATVKGDVIIGKGTKVLAGSYIEGPVRIGESCEIGPNCYIRPGTTIGDSCHVGAAVELKNTIFFSGTVASHLTYIGDSILGENVNVGGGTLVANLRHDGQSVKSMVKGKLVDTGRRKFGTVIGDGAHLGAGTIIYPGRKIGTKCDTLPGEIVKKDIG